MLVRGFLIMALVALLPGGEGTSGRYAGEWQAAEIVAFKDFDDLEVRLDGKRYKAFLVGLCPLRETVANEDRRARLRKMILAKMQKSSLSARVVTKRGEVVGLSVDTFMHHKNDFKHPWNPTEYPYGWTGWGAYNFNTYFLHTKIATFQDNFGTNKRWREQFTEVVCAMRGAERASTLVQDLGARQFAKRDRASKELKAIGSPALGPLRKAALTGDLEGRRRAEQIIRTITEGTTDKRPTKQAWAAPAK